MIQTVYEARAVWKFEGSSLKDVEKFSDSKSQMSQSSGNSHQLESDRSISRFEISNEKSKRQFLIQNLVDSIPKMKEMKSVNDRREAMKVLHILGSDIMLMNCLAQIGM